MIILGSLTDAEREMWSDGDWRTAPRILVQSKPKGPLSPVESFLLRCWRRLSSGRAPGFDGPGPLNWSDMQQLFDREGVRDPVLRETYEGFLYRVDAAAQKQAKVLNA